MVGPPHRALFLHAAENRNPHAVLARMLDRIDPAVGPAEPVAELERRVADLLGTESALFFPSGTMAQQTALRIHADRTARRTFVAHPHTHLDNWEERGYAVVHGLGLRHAGDRNLPLTTADLRAVGEPPAAVVWELPQRDLGGTLPEWDELVEQIGVARELGAATHLDGARLWEAQPYYGRPHAEIAGLFDTVYVSLYKGLNGIRGAVLAGTAATTATAAVWRRRLGGAIPDAWPLALTALDGLDTHVPRMAAYRDHAVALATAIEADGVARAVPCPPLTPLFHVHLPVAPAALRHAADALLADRGVRMFGRARSSDDPHRSSFEITVSEPALDFNPAEVAQLIRELVDRAR